MKIKRIEVNSPNGFRGLPNGFVIKFRETENRNEIDPVCLAGLNGSGKSNILELISEIFFYLEAIHHPSAKKYIDNKASFGFSIEYETKVTINNRMTNDPYFTSKSNVGETRQVLITKAPKKEPVIKYRKQKKESWKVLNPEHNQYDYNAGQILPSNIIAYSSGQNELISNPFLRMDFFYFDQYKKESLEEESAAVLNNRLFFMNYDSNAFVLISNYLMRDVSGSERQKELNILREMTQVQDVESFEVVLNLKVKKELTTDQLMELLESYEGTETSTVLKGLKGQLVWDIDLPYRLDNFIEMLEQCSTYANIVYDGEDVYSRKRLKVTLYFRYINKEIKEVFQDKFAKGGALGLFRDFYLLNLLNIYNYSDEIVERVMQAPSGTSDNISDLIPDLPKEDKVFYIKNLKLKKKGRSRKMLFYKNLSDGEHQFLHIIGSLMLMEEEGTIFLLDEPSTHFNPEWRAKFVDTANKIHEERKKRVADEDLANQLVMLTTHSPFVLSDSKSENVLWLKRENGEPKILDLDFETYGASIDFIMKRINQLQQRPTRLIPERAYNDLMEDIKSSNLGVLRRAIERYGESPEKQYLYQRIYELTNPPEQTDDHSTK